MMPNQHEGSGADQKTIEAFNDPIIAALGLDLNTAAVVAAAASTRDRPVAYIIREILKKHADVELKVSMCVVEYRNKSGDEEKTSNRRQPLRPKVCLSIYERDGGRCHYCGTEIPRNSDWHIDHKHPRSLGGSDAEDNLVLACAPCNLAKSDTPYDEFIASVMREMDVNSQREMAVAWCTSGRARK
jgi:5-methylcytosine-specific restriction endonuclease McrA